MSDAPMLRRTHTLPVYPVKGCRCRPEDAQIVIFFFGAHEMCEFRGAEDLWMLVALPVSAQLVCKHFLFGLCSEAAGGWCDWQVGL